MQSWGKFPKAEQEAYPLFSVPSKLPHIPGKSLLAYGQGRSYGDSCLNDGGALLLTKHLDHFIAFDEKTGVIRCEAGVTLEAVLKIAVPRGWFLRVSPGTQYVSVAGALANDIHGKNHHVDGTFGNWVTRFELLRSDGTRLICSKTENAEWFAATIGGLGLTGFIIWVEFQLRPITSALVDQETIRFENLDAFFPLSAESDKFPYVVAWIDCLSTGRSLGRGILIRGDHHQATGPIIKKQPRSKSVPVDFPNFVLNPLSIRAFNFLYYHKQLRKSVQSTIPYEPFFYPLDAISHWNRIYGKRGFLQYQLVVPLHAVDAIKEILNCVAKEKLASFLAVLKIFGAPKSPGLLSFPRPGITLAMDFPNSGEKLFRLLDRMDKLVVESGGAIYPAKDARMSPETFRASFPKLDEFKKFLDPGFSSSFWRRVNQ